MPNPCLCMYECQIYKQSDCVKQLQSDMIIIHQLSGWHFFFWSSRDIVAHIPQSTIEKIEKITYWSVCSHAFTSFLSAISLPPFLVSATATSPDTMSDCQRDLKLYIFGGGVCPAKFQLQRYNPCWTEYRGDEGGGCSTVGVFTNPLFNPYVILSMDIVR